MTDHECIQCRAPSKGHDGCWGPGEVALYGSLFCCSLACAEKWARENGREGCRPGEPGFFVS